MARIFLSQNAAKPEEAAGEAAKEKSKSVLRKLEQRRLTGKVDHMLETQFQAGRLYASISSRPGQSGRCDGYILEGKELECQSYPTPP